MNIEVTKEYDHTEIDKKRAQLEVENKKKMQTTHIKDKFGNSSHDILEEE